MKSVLPRMGIGIVDILLTLVIVLGVTVAMLKWRKKDNANLIKKVQEAGVTIDPAQSQSPQAIENAVGTHLQSLSDKHAQELECKTEGNCPVEGASPSQ